MQEKLIIFLHAQQLEQPSWVISDGKAVSDEITGTVTDLYTISQGKEVIVVVPAEDVLMLTAKLPKMKRSKLETALPFALEEQIIGDIDALHFVPFDYQGDATLPVAVVAKEKMQSWLALLKSWQITPDQMLPASFLVNWHENHWHIMVGEITLLRFGQYQVMSCDNSNLHAVLEMAFAEFNTMPEEIHIRYYNTKSPLLNLPAGINCKQEIRFPSNLHVDLAKNTSEITVSLLHGIFAAKKPKYSQTKPMWQITFYLIASWVVLLLMLPLISIFILQYKANTLTAQIAAIYQQNFPADRDVIEPKFRMQQKLQKLVTKRGDQNNLLLLSYLGKGLAQANGIYIKRLEYSLNQMTVELVATSSDEISTFTDYLTQQGLKVKQQNAKLNGTHISATIVIA